MVEYTVNEIFIIKMVSVLITIYNLPKIIYNIFEDDSEKHCKKVLKL